MAQQPLDCPECGSKEVAVDAERGERICTGCGIVISQRGDSVDLGWEGRAYDYNEQSVRMRTGAGDKVMRADLGRGSDFGTWTDGKGATLPEETQHMMRRLKRHTWTHVDGRRRNLQLALPLINTMCVKLKLPLFVKEEAAALYRRCISANLIRGRSIDLMVLACMYAACKIRGVPRTINEIMDCDLGRPYRRKEMTRCYRTILKKLKMKTPRSPATRHLTLIGNKAGISIQAQEIAADIIRLSQGLQGDLGTSGKDPRGIASAALWLAQKQTGEKVSQKTISNAAGTTEVTLRNRANQLKKMLRQMEKEKDVPAREESAVVPIT